MRLVSFTSLFSPTLIVLTVVLFGFGTTLKAQGKMKAPQKQQSKVAPKLPSTAPSLPSTPPSRTFVVAKTAEELLDSLDGKVDSEIAVVFGATLPEDEIEKVVKILRARYPLISVRNRLGVHATPPQDPIDMANDRAQKSVESKLVPLYRDSRAEALAQLHSDEVAGFINRPRNGFARMRSRSISPYDLKLEGRLASRLQTQPVTSDLRAEVEVELQSPAPLNPKASWQEVQRGRYTLSENGMPTAEMTQLFHRLTASQFADGYSNGWVKSVDQTAGFNAHRAKFAEGWSQSMTLTTREEVRQFFKDTDEKTSIEVDWKLNQMQLVSLLLHEEARVYVSENLPDMEELSGADVETRGLSPFETDALERMRADENIVTRATPNRLQMMGALRATQECMQCHNVQEDELLGAFSYEFLRDPKLNLEPKGYRP